MLRRISCPEVKGQTFQGPRQEVYLNMSRCFQAFQMTCTLMISVPITSRTAGSDSLKMTPSKKKRTISFPRNVKRKQGTRISKAPIPHLKTRPLPQAIQIQEPKSLPPSITTANSVQTITAQTTAPIASTPRT